MRQFSITVKGIFNELFLVLTLLLIKIKDLDFLSWAHMNILTFDIYSTEDKWLNYPLKIDVHLPRVLDLLDERGIKATFFYLRWIARIYSDVIKGINDRGHEITCHTDKYFFVREMHLESFKEDLNSALSSLENITSNKIKSFRDPSFKYY